MARLSAVVLECVTSFSSTSIWSFFLAKGRAKRMTVDRIVATCFWTHPSSISFKQYSWITWMTSWSSCRTIVWMERTFCNVAAWQLSCPCVNLWSKEWSISVTWAKELFSSRTTISHLPAILSSTNTTKSSSPFVPRSSTEKYLSCNPKWIQSVETTGLLLPLLDLRWKNPGSARGVDVFMRVKR